jgi:hypothetical protein
MFLSTAICTTVFAEDWTLVAKRLVRKYNGLHPDHSVKLNAGIPTFDVIKGKAWRGIGVKISHIIEYREKWSQFPRALSTF